MWLRQEPVSRQVFWAPASPVLGAQGPGSRNPSSSTAGRVPRETKPTHSSLQDKVLRASPRSLADSESPPLPFRSFLQPLFGTASRGHLHSIETEISQAPALGRPVAAVPSPAGGQRGPARGPAEPRTRPTGLRGWAASEHRGLSSCESRARATDAGRQLSKDIRSQRKGPEYEDYATPWVKIKGQGRRGIRQ